MTTNAFLGAVKENCIILCVRIKLQSNPYYHNKKFIHNESLVLTDKVTESVRS